MCQKIEKRERQREIQREKEEGKERERERERGDLYEGLFCSQQYVQVDENFAKWDLVFREREREMSRHMYYASKSIMEHTLSLFHTHLIFIPGR